MEFKNEIYILLISSFFSLLYYFYDKKNKNMSNVWDIQLKNVYTPLMITFDTLSINKKTIDELIDDLYILIIENYTYCPYDIIDIILELKENKQELSSEEIKNKLKKLNKIIIRRYFNLQIKLLYNSVPEFYGLKLKLYISRFFGYLIKYSVYFSFFMILVLFIFKSYYIYIAALFHLLSYVLVYVFNSLCNKWLDKLTDIIIGKTDNKIE